MQFSRFIFPGLLSAGFLVCGFFWMKEEVTTRIYRQKLEALAGEYSELAERYNYAVRQSAITELEVTEDNVAVRIRTIDGNIKRIETPYHPSQEIFVDYLVGNGRIWIRRLFDQRTSPDNGFIIDPMWESVDWESGKVNYGKVIYRSLEPGIWTIQVSGNGSLSLEPSLVSHPDDLVGDFNIRSFEEIKLSLDEEVQAISWCDLWNFCVSAVRDQAASQN